MITASRSLPWLLPHSQRRPSLLGALFLALACHSSPSPSPTSLTDVAWQLVTLDGLEAGQGAGGQPATLLLGADHRASGFAGCNRFSGTYELAGDQLSFGPLAMTRMACTEGMDLEQRFSKVLQATKNYRVSATGLELMDGEKLLAHLVPPPTATTY